MFWLFRGHSQGACYMVQWKNAVYIFQVTVIYIIVLQFQFTGLYKNGHNWLMCMLSYKI